MLFLLLIASVSLVFAAEAEVKAEVKAEIKEELKPEESSHRHDGYSFADGLELMRHREERYHAEREHILKGDGNPYRDNRDHRDMHEDLPGPVILRTPGPLPHQGHPNIEAQNKIIADVFAPDYYQPTWVLDYRYLKTGGRDYTRGPGGQILILPRGVRTKEHKDFPDYDAYLEHLRLSRIAEEEQRHRHSHAHGYGHEDWQYSRNHRGHDQGHRGHDQGHHAHHEQNPHGHGQTMWHKYG